MNRFLALYVLLLISASVKAECIKPDDTVLTVDGIVTQENFPGPPNYESVESGDKNEIYWFINSTKEFCVADSENENIKKFQLYFKNGVPNYLEKNKKYSIVGITFMGVSGHHHSNVLIEVSNVKGL